VRVVHHRRHLARELEVALRVEGGAGVFGELLHAPFDQRR
jgi:hypothetical protein